MIVVLKPNPNPDQLESLKNWLLGKGIQIHTSLGTSQMILGLVGDTSTLDIDLISALDIVEDVKRVQEPYKNANRKFHPEDTIIPVGNTQIGGGTLTIMAGPCSVESEEQIVTVAKAVKASGATMLRGGAFKPRTSPYAFQGMGAEGLELMKLARTAHTTRERVDSAWRVAGDTLAIAQMMEGSTGLLLVSFFLFYLGF